MKIVTRDASWSVISHLAQVNAGCSSPFSLALRPSSTRQVWPSIHGRANRSPVDVRSEAGARWGFSPGMPRRRASWERLCPARILISGGSAPVRAGRPRPSGRADSQDPPFPGRYPGERRRRGIHWRNDHPAPAPEAEGPRQAHPAAGPPAPLPEAARRSASPRSRPRAGLRSSAARSAGGSSTRRASSAGDASRRSSHGGTRRTAAPSSPGPPCTTATTYISANGCRGGSGSSASTAGRPSSPTSWRTAASGSGCACRCGSTGAAARSWWPCPPERRRPTWTTTFSCARRPPTPGAGGPS